MAKIERIKIVLDVTGENATIIRKGLDAKLKAENRKKYNEAVEDILVTFFKEKEIEEKTRTLLSIPQGVPRLPLGQLPAAEISVLKDQQWTIQ